MILVLFYAEELKRDVLDTIQATDSLAATQRVPKGTKNPVDKALEPPRQFAAGGTDCVPSAALRQYSLTCQ